MNLAILPEVYSICRLAPAANIPTWATQSDFYAVTRTSDELSIVCLQTDIPTTVQSEGDWRILKVDAVLNFSLTGVLASLAAPLAEAKISIFAISTFDTDYLLVKANTLEQAANVLQAAGHCVE